MPSFSRRMKALRRVVQVPRDRPQAYRSLRSKILTVTFVVPEAAFAASGPAPLVHPASIDPAAAATPSLRNSLRSMSAPLRGIIMETGDRREAEFSRERGLSRGGFPAMIVLRMFARRSPE